MSAKAQTLTPDRPLTSTVLAIVLALGIGATAGSVITNAVNNDAGTTTERDVVGIVPWDQQKLQAAGDRQASATITADGPGIRPWDQGMLDAMEDRQAGSS